MGSEKGEYSNNRLNDTLSSLRSHSKKLTQSSICGCCTLWNCYPLKITHFISFIKHINVTTVTTGFIASNNNGTVDVPDSFSVQEVNTLKFLLIQTEKQVSKSDIS